MFKLHFALILLLLYIGVFTDARRDVRRRQVSIPVVDGGVEYYDLEDELDVNLVSPCNDARRGDPDLTTYDILSSYRFDEQHYQYEGVQQIVGSSGYQTAYRFEEYSNMTIESTQAFPKGVPSEFSFECTFRVPQNHPKNEWFLFELANYEFESLMSVTMNPIFNTIDFSISKYDGSIQTVSFEKTEIFDRSWHKVMLGVTQDTVRLWVDCNPVADRNGSYRIPLDIRAPIDANDGIFSVAKNCRNRQTVPIDLQWMIFSCDVDKPDHTSCEDLPQYAKSPNIIVHPDPGPWPSPQPIPLPEPNIPYYPETTTEPFREPPNFSFLTTSTYRPRIISTTPSSLTGQEVHAFDCPESCPAGPPGVSGIPGLVGPPGPPGPPGPSSLLASEITERERVIGSKGEKGDQGLQGLQGERGERGLRGERGTHGERGERGEQGEFGLQGPIGPSGIQGPPGPPGPPGISVNGDYRNPVPVQYDTRSLDDSEIRDICMTVVREYISEISSTLMGPPGPPGRRGPSRPGPPGPAGIQGDTGPRGPPGPNGYPGPPGMPGNNGEPGNRGEAGQKGDRGEDGVGREGPMGPPGAIGPDGRAGLEGRQGRPGERGEKGPPGENGVRGPDGVPGVCDCSAYQAAYAYPMLLAQQQQNNKGPPNYYNKGPQNYYNKGP